MIVLASAGWIMRRVVAGSFVLGVSEILDPPFESVQDVWEEQRMYIALIPPSHAATRPIAASHPVAT